MTSLFDVVGNDLDRAYLNLKDPVHPAESAIRDVLEAMWSRYEIYAEEGFRRGFARDVEARFWEMFLGCTLLDDGRTLLPASERRRTGGQPDLCVVEPGQFRRPRPINMGGRFMAAPIRQAQLRISSGFLTKAEKIDSYLDEEVIGQDDVRIVAINGARFTPYVSDQPLPLVLRTLFPIGDEYAVMDTQTGDIVKLGYRYSPEIRRAGDGDPALRFPRRSLCERLGAALVRRRRRRDVAAEQTAHLCP